MAPKSNTKSTDKSKGGAAGNKNKGKSKDDGEDSKGGGAGKLKAANSINVRHILVGLSPGILREKRISAKRDLKCEKHSKKEEALTKLRDGVKFDDVAREFSEDKARQGMSPTQ